MSDGSIASSAAPVAITLNGRAESVPEGTSVLDLLSRLALPKERVAVELDGEIVRKAEYGSRRLSAGARIEVVSFVGGG